MYIFFIVCFDLAVTQSIPMLSILENLLLLCCGLFRGGVLQMPRSCLRRVCPCLSILQTYGPPYVGMSGGPFGAIAEHAAD